MLATIMVIGGEKTPEICDALRAEGISAAAVESSARIRA
jgi:hypothetical protein